MNKAQLQILQQIKKQALKHSVSLSSSSCTLLKLCSLNSFCLPNLFVCCVPKIHPGSVSTPSCHALLTCSTLTPLVWKRGLIAKNIRLPQSPSKNGSVDFKAMLGNSWVKQVLSFSYLIPNSMACVCPVLQQN